MRRLTKIEYGCLLALSASTRSEDPNTKVGCAIENSNGKIIATGYNGLKSGFSYEQINISSREDKLRHFIHAETNALSEIVKGSGRTIYLTHSPCQYCAQNITAHGIDNVIYINEYHGCKEFKRIFTAFNIQYREINNDERQNIITAIKQLEANL